jgi:hypothetical protein
MLSARACFLDETDGEDENGLKYKPRDRTAEMKKPKTTLRNRLLRGLRLLELFRVVTRSSLDTDVPSGSNGEPTLRRLGVAIVSEPCIYCYCVERETCSYFMTSSYSIPIH